MSSRQEQSQWNLESDEPYPELWVSNESIRNR